MVLRWYSVVVDCHDVRKQAAWWAEALSWKTIHATAEECANTSQDRDAEIARLESLGARRADVGQPGSASFTVLTDPEGNEFCVLSSRDA
ncbi:VOC family protein [Kribbella sp. NPDC059898]|uniref:VOC family protein n=1 Tax=Kribbella sp. NPDC059898 TaxID=3346995 RepID=UPI003657033B